MPPWHPPLTENRNAVLRRNGQVSIYFRPRSLKMDCYAQRILPACMGDAKVSQTETSIASQKKGFALAQGTPAHAMEPWLQLITNVSSARGAYAGGCATTTRNKRSEKLRQPADGRIRETPTLGAI